MKLYRIILPVDNIEIASLFYAYVLGKEGIRVSAGRHYFELEGVILACYDPVADGDSDEPKWMQHPNQFVYFAVDDLEQVHTRLKSSHAKKVDDTIEWMPWGERLFYAEDPFGNPICFVDRATMFLG